MKKAIEFIKHIGRDRFFVYLSIILFILGYVFIHREDLEDWPWALPIILSLTVGPLGYWVWTSIKSWRNRNK